jgi:tRNA1Val (adenine37-N6)-methyltransferase
LFTLDSIRDIRIYQSRSGYRFSVDALMLFSFVNLARADHIADLGAGSGIVGILLAKKYPASRFTLIELQEGLAALAERNISLNALQERVVAVNADVKTLSLRKRTAECGPAKDQGAPDLSDEAGLGARLSAGCYDLVVSNPPFRRARSGKISEGDEKALARHELALTLTDVVEAASALLRHRGRFFIVYLPERLADLIAALRPKALEPKRVRFVHSHISSEAKMVLVEAVKGGKAGLKVEKPLCIYDEGRTYSAEVRALYGQ